MNLLKKSKRVLSVIMMVCLLAGMVPSALAEASFKAVVTAKNMKVYSTKGKHKYLGKLKKGTVVTVKDYKKGVAKISYKGKTGLAYIKNMDRLEEDEKVESTPAVALRKIKIYKKASTSSKYTTVKKGTELNIIAVNGKFAKVERNGAVGYALSKYLGDPETLKKEEENDSAQGGLSIDVVTTKSAKIYKKASTSSKYTTVPKGTALKVIALNGSIAKVEKDGAVGYTDKANLAEKSEITEEKPATSDKKEEVSDDKKEETTDKKEETTDKKEESTSSNPIFNSSYSNEQITYLFLTKVMGYNTAAAVGVMANIKYESGYKPVSNGDSGSSYGICQWHAGRKTRLINWCNDNGYDHATLEGQLYYLQYDLTHSYTKVHNYLKAVENSGQGAYEAGYYFCYHFEGPSNKAAKSDTRGVYARDTLWERYGN